MRARLIIVWFALVFCGPAFGQTVDEFPSLQQQWEATAAQAEAVIENADATESELLKTRQALDEERQEVNAYIADAEERVSPLLSQRDTLGPVPETGDEPPEVAAVRLDLEEQISRENGPLLAARQIRERINADILAIDRVQRKRFSDQLLTRTGFPLSGDALFEFLDDLDSSIKSALEAFNNRWASLTAAGFVASVLPANIAIFLLGVGILFFGAAAFRRYVVSHADQYLSGFVTRKLLSAFNIFIIMLAGYSMMIWAVQSTIFVGVNADGLFRAFDFIFGAFLVALWITRVVRHDAKEFGSGAALIIGALLFAVDWNLRPLVNYSPWDAISVTVAHFIVAVLYFPIASKISNADRFYAYFERPTHPVVLRFTEAVRIILRYSNWVILLLAVVGYFALSRQMLVAISATFGLSLFGYWIFETITELGFNIIGRLRGEPTIDEDATSDVGHGDAEDERSALWPVLVAIAVVAVIVPLILIAWGLDANLMLELWVSLVQGFTVGGVRLSLGAIAGFAIAFTIGFFIVRGLQALLSNFILPRTRMETGARAAIVSLFGYFGFTIAALIAFSAAGFDLGSLAVIFGALSVGIGFGLQNIVSNFVSGIILLIERPIKKGDWVSVSGNEGYVRDIKVRATEIETFDRATVIVPNSDLISQPVLNWVYASKSARIRIPIGVSYDSDPKRVRDVLLEIAADSNWALRIPAPQAMFMTFGDSSLNFELRFHIRDADNTVAATSDTNYAIFERFKEENIDIPFPIRDVRITRGE